MFIRRSYKRKQVACHTCTLHIPRRHRIGYCPHQNEQHTQYTLSSFVEILELILTVSLYTQPDIPVCTV